MKFSLIIPCYNEEEVIQITYDKLMEYIPNIADSYEIIFVDDGSKDRTLILLKEFALKNHNIKILSFSRNFGQQCALYAGLEESTGDYIAFIDADLQDPPEILPDMLKKMQEEQADVIYGQRLKREKESFFKKFTSKIYYRIFNAISDLNVPVDASDFRIITRKIADEILKMQETDMYLRAMITYVGYKQIPFPFNRPARAAGETKYTLSKMFKLAEDSFISFSTKLLKIPMLCTFFSATLMIVFLILGIAGIKISNMLFLFFVASFSTLVLGCLAIIGLYLIRIHNKTKNRPRYIIANRINFEGGKQH